MRQLAPVLVSAPEAPPVSVAEAKRHLRVDDSDNDEVIEAAILAAVAHLDGYAGILGRALVTQSWRQDFGFWPASRCLALPLAPVASIAGVTARDSAGAVTTLDPSGYRLLGEGSQPFVMLSLNASLPALDCAPDAVAVTFVAGYGAADKVPAAIRSAILLMVGDLYRYRETAGLGSIAAVPMSTTVDRLLTPYRRLFVS